MPALPRAFRQASRSRLKSSGRWSESFLFALGFTDLRVRLRDGSALLQLPAAQHAAARARWPEITAGLSEYFSTIQLDPKARAESE